MTKKGALHDIISLAILETVEQTPLLGCPMRIRLFSLKTEKVSRIYDGKVKKLNLYCSMMR